MIAAISQIDKKKELEGVILEYESQLFDLEREIEEKSRYL